MSAQNGDVVKIGGFELRFLVDETQSSGNVVVFEFAIPPNGRVPAAHYHKDVDEVVYGLEGTMTSTLGDKKYELRNGDSLFIPRGSVHTHENFGTDTAKALAVLTPGSIGRKYFEEIGEAVNVPGKPDIEKIKEIMLRHGLVPA